MLTFIKYINRRIGALLNAIHEILINYWINCAIILVATSSAENIITVNIAIDISRIGFVIDCYQY